MTPLHFKVIHIYIGRKVSFFFVLVCRGGGREREIWSVPTVPNHTIWKALSHISKFLYVNYWYILFMHTGWKMTQDWIAIRRSYSCKTFYACRGNEGTVYSLSITLFWCFINFCHQAALTKRENLYTLELRLYFWKYF